MSTLRKNVTGRKIPGLENDDRAGRIVAQFTERDRQRFARIADADDFVPVRCVGLGKDRRADRDRAGKLGLAGAAHRAQFAERDATGLIVAGDALHRAVQVDRCVVTGFTQERDHTLRLAQRISADKVGTLGK